MELHYLKIKAEYAHNIYVGIKTFELRKNDRNYQVGDLITFEVVEDKENNWINLDQNWIHNFETKVFRIEYITKNVPQYGLKWNYCILAIKELK